MKQCPNRTGLSRILIPGMWKSRELVRYSGSPTKDQGAGTGHFTCISPQRQAQRVCLENSGCEFFHHSSSRPSASPISRLRSRNSSTVRCRAAALASVVWTHALLNPVEETRLGQFSRKNYSVLPRMPSRELVDVYFLTQGVNINIMHDMLFGDWQLISSIVRPK